jgi:polysaccharide export outer membrane protein
MSAASDARQIRSAAQRALGESDRRSRVPNPVEIDLMAMNLFRLLGGFALVLLAFALLSPAPAMAQQGAAAGATTAPAAIAGVGPDYRLGAGDVVRVTVFQNPDLAAEVRVSEAGTIVFPLLGSVKIGGMTALEAERRIADGLRTGNFVKQPQVSMVVTLVRSNVVSVLGQVGRPGRYPVESPDMRLTDLLANAGGINPTAADTVVVTGLRNGQPFRAEVDVGRTISTGNRAADVVIQNGDVVYVDRGPTVYIYGEVQRPGALRLERGMTVLQALASGGGLTQRGTERGMRLHRRAADGKIAITQPNMDEALRDGDVIYVRESIF